VLFWVQARVFGLSYAGYHAVSLGLHLLNATLLGLLLYRLLSRHIPTNTSKQPQAKPPAAILAALAAAIVTLHPAPFEAVVWVSAQSELLAATFLLLMLHAWLTGRPATDDQELLRNYSWAFVATLMLTLALLTKESAAIGIVLLVLMDVGLNGRQLRFAPHSVGLRRMGAYLPPLLVTLAYLALQLVVEQRNYIVEQGGYGLGPQLVLNPLRALALLLGPLPNTEHASASWLVLAGAFVALVLLLMLVRGPWQVQLAILALGVVLLPTAPFAAPPNSRYLYLPVMAGVVVVSLWISERGLMRQRVPVVRPWPSARALLFFAVVLFLAYTTELSAREARFAVAGGADGSLWNVASDLCGERSLDRVIVLRAPIAEQHSRAILELACGNTITPIFVDLPEHAEANLEANSVIIDFPNGGARVAKQT
jgi:hypothetical protein